MRRWWHNPVMLFAVSWIVFIALVWEEVTMPTFATVVVAIFLRTRRSMVHHYVPKVAGLILFILAFVQHGRHINPEMGLNLLFAVLAMKMLEARTGRDWRMLALGTFILWASGALFIKTPLYFLCAISGCGAALMAMVKGLGDEIAVSWRELWVWVLRALPVAVVLFFLLPRFSAGLWTPPTPVPQGRVGFSEEVKPGEVNELNMTGELAFHAMVTPLPAMRDLYWRGMTLTGHDGWNWYPIARDEDWGEFSGTGRIAAPGWWHQDIIHKGSVRRGFALETPQWWESEGKQAAAGDNGTIRFSPYKTLRRYSVLSSPTAGTLLLNKHVEKENLLAFNKRKLPTGLSDFSGTLENALDRLEAFFREQGFTYTLAPGKVATFKDFFTSKRGWCAHYASSTALILRSWGFPSRLVSGYLGGDLNTVSNYYSVSEDDAHVWVETWNGKSWQRIDPTLWVVPERGEVPAAEFFRRRAPDGFLDRRHWPAWTRDAQMWMDSVNYRFLVWSEEFDRDQQKTWAGKLEWNLSTFYMAGLWFLVASMLGYWFWEWWCTRARPTARSERAEVWNQFVKWLGPEGSLLKPNIGPQEAREILQAREFQRKSQGLQWLSEWEKQIYASESSVADLKELKHLLSKR